MNLVADEGLERAVVTRLRADGHSVVWIAELAPSIPDEEVLRIAETDNSILITEDKDFGELIYRRKLGHSGVLLVRLEGFSNVAKAEVVSETLRVHAAELPGAFSVVSPETIRIRRAVVSNSP